MTAPRPLFVIAGEPSGDALGAALIAGLREAAPGPLHVIGVGGPLMQHEGLDSLFPMDELSIMGIAEILPRLPQLMRRIRQTADAAIAADPPALITIDSPDFCLRVAARVRKARPETRTIHYVAPSVWAWRPGRAAKMARVIDHVLALLPFEPPYMQAAGMTCDFVGHPVTTLPVPTVAEVAALRASLGIPAEARLVTLLPGSRAGEVRRIGPVLFAVAERLLAEDPTLAFVVPSVGVRVDQIRALCAETSLRPHILDPRALAPAEAEMRKRAAFAASDLALAASGTVALELAATATPMIVAYDANALTGFLVRRMALIDSANLVNLVTDSRVIPEFLLDRCRPDLIAADARRLLGSASARREQIEVSTRAMTLLGRGGPPPGLRAARSVLAHIAGPA